MQLLFAGTRGSMPVCSPDRRTYGGDTTCLLVLGQQGEQVLVDAGTGLHGANGYLDPQRPVHVLFTHFHLDHLTGLPSWDALYTPGRELVFAGPQADGATVEAAVSGLIGPPYWPVPLNSLGSRLSFTDLAPRSADASLLRIGGLEVRWMPLPHPGGCTAYRFDEPASGLDPRARIEMRNLLKRLQGMGKTILVSSHILPEHTSWQGAADLAGEVGCDHLSLTHHDPLADDTTLIAREARLQAVLPDADLARQGTVVDLSRKVRP